MPSKRQVTLWNTIAAVSAAALMAGVAGTAHAQSEAADTIPTNAGEIAIHPVSHASLVLVSGETAIFVDPVGGADAYAGLPASDLILITHEHGDHFNAETLAGLVGEGTQLITSQSVYDKLPDDLKAIATPLANGGTSAFAEIAIEAVPAYNTTADRLQFHPQGRDNGYVLTIDGARVYIAGDTEDIPEMRALKDIDLAFVPMNLPYTMTVEQAADAVKAFAPKVVYPYHYADSDVEMFRSLVEQGGGATEVRLGAWYE